MSKIGVTIRSLFQPRAAFGCGCKDRCPAARTRGDKKPPWRTRRAANIRQMARAGHPLRPAKGVQSREKQVLTIATSLRASIMLYGVINAAGQVVRCGLQNLRMEFPIFFFSGIMYGLKPIIHTKAAIHAVMEGVPSLKRVDHPEFAVSSVRHATSQWVGKADQVEWQA